MSVIKYGKPADWISYDFKEVATPLAEAKAAVETLKLLPRTRDYTERWKAEQLRREAAGTSRIEGAEFTEDELDEALRETSAEYGLTHSQRQARAAEQTYRWLTALPSGYPFGGDLIKEIHRRIVRGCDDDHCEPGALRRSGQNVIFGLPQHRGAEGGNECGEALEELVRAASREFGSHDPLIQSLAVHYHLAAIHPFLDGNGRTARAAEAFMLRKAGLQEEIFIPVSNFYYENNAEYLKVLSETAGKHGDLTDFVKFGLRGIKTLCKRAAGEIALHLRKSLFRERMHELFGKLESPRKRVIAERQMRLLNILLEKGSLPAEDFAKEAVSRSLYSGLKKLDNAIQRDFKKLLDLEAVKVDEATNEMSINLLWAEKMSEKEFKEKFDLLPKARSYL
ncbi:MAG: Fic family protein [Candidatus Dadabacteria bacterium]|nr:Fic family protein [Candidatus Dadabacteria bacterium]